MVYRVPVTEDVAALAKETSELHAANLQAQEDRALDSIVDIWYRHGYHGPINLVRIGDLMKECFRAGWHARRLFRNDGDRRYGTK
jgi:hypothetical protein